MFTACFQTVLYFFRYTKSVCLKLQSSTLDIVQGLEMVTHTMSILESARVDSAEFVLVFTEM